MRLVYVVIAGILVAILGYVLFWHPGLPNRQTSAVDTSYETATSGRYNSSPSLDPMRGSETAAEETERSKELISSIYDYGPEYREKAIKAAEDLIQYYPRESYNRWRPIRVDPFSFLNGSYLEEGAMPKTISVTPFPSDSFVADQIQYTIFDGSTKGAIWRGKIRGSEIGQIEVSIGGGIESPDFLIRVMNYPNPTITISSTESSDVYMAVEVNPYLVQSLD